ncbi:ABC transporter ATP-binding protein [Oleidesulfovibrio sp.]|uniref:ABC transporter ATP-binding protein n=1 Tax=Oleidesulfovibrio sp. TaxID=2909707 RepID=UPI003A84AFC8
MEKVSLTNISKRYGDVRVIHDVSLSIKENEFIVLVGPSGCGKSTILRMIAGLESVSGGEIRIGDRVVNDVPPKERDVAMVFQNYALYPHMTVGENMGFSLKMQKRPKDEIERKVHEAAEILGLTDYLARKPAALSGGQRQRVAMGRAIVRKPQVFLFDEPLSNLDAQLRTQMRMELKKLHLKLNTTTIYVTHDQVEAMTLADRIVLLKDGHIQQVGAPVEVFEQPVNVFTGRFIGNPPMNVLQGTFYSDGSGKHVAIESLRIPLPDTTGTTLADGTAVIIGIRPDAIKTGDALTHLPQAATSDARVEVAEILGGQSLLEISAGGISMIAEVAGRVLVRPGNTIRVGIDPERVLLFDPQTQMAVA